MGDCMDNLVVWCGDIGSLKNNKFGWCRGLIKGDRPWFIEGTDIVEFCSGISKDLTDGKKIAIGFECPLFVPIPDNPVLLTSARQGEGNRAWSAGAGSGALATGLTETVWIFSKIREMAKLGIKVTFNWQRFIDCDFNLFIWEAFVTKDSKAQTHHGDAKIAVEKFVNEYPNIEQANSVTTEKPYNLAGASLLRAGLTNDIGLLSQSCVVLKA